MKMLNLNIGNIARRDLFRLAGVTVVGGALAANLPPGLMRLAHASVDRGRVMDAEVLTIELGEMFFRTEGGRENEPIRLHAGETYDMTFRNVGGIEHEVMIGRNLAVENGRPHGYETNLLDAEEVKYLGHGWEVEAFGMKEIELAPGEEARLVFTLPPTKAGEWEIGCFVPGHYEAGMKAPVIVELAVG